MKSVIRTALLGALAMLALSLATAGVAAAATKPEFKPVPTKKKFTSTAGGGTWKYLGGEKIHCTNSSLAGEISSAQAVGKVLITWTGCTSINLKGEECAANSEGAKAGEIVTKPLSGELGTVAKGEAETGVGLLFKPESKKNWFLLQGNKCALGVAFAGTLAAEVEYVGVKKATNALIVEGAGEGLKIKEITLDSGLVEKPRFEAFDKGVTFDTVYELTFEEPVEIT